MERVIFCRAESTLLRLGVRTPEYDVTTLTDGIACVRWAIAANNLSSQSHPDTGLFRPAHDRERDRCRHEGSPVTNAFHPLRARCRGHYRLDFRRRVTPVRHRVTLTLHRRNAKKSFDGKSLRESISARNSSCNVGQLAAKFPQNLAVSDAVTSLNDCMMPNTNLTTQPHHWSAAARASSRQTPHRHDAPLPPTLDGGTR